MTQDLFPRLASRGPIEAAAKGSLRPRTAVIITAAPEHAADVKSQPARSPTPRVAANTATAVQKVWQAKQLMK
ncbi:MAG: hypothetical protein EDS66_17405 [Planctomycetota bacterium]|nr:MAG: hypothetical protein EDS66_17405 [Planctomycetota bacterium]